MNTAFKNIVLVHNTTHDASVETVNLLLTILKKYNTSVELSQTGPQKTLKLKNTTQNADLCIVIGGDGTLLSAARYFAPKNVPLFGINCGNLGFLSQSSTQELQLSIEKLFNKEYKIEERLMTQAVDNLEKPSFNLFALNDMVIKRGPTSGTMLLCVYVGQNKLNDFYGDGLIVSTPTGSTAYNLSVGGPIVAPTIGCMIVSPIASHSLAIRPIVIPDTSLVKILISNEQHQACLTADGQDHYELSEGSIIYVRKLEYKAKLIIMSNDENNFYNILRNKLHWGIFPGTCPPIIANINDKSCKNCF